MQHRVELGRRGRIGRRHFLIRKSQQGLILVLHCSVLRSIKLVLADDDPVVGGCLDIARSGSEVGEYLKI